jgi:hypothetical protein
MCEQWNPGLPLSLYAACEALLRETGQKLEMILLEKEKAKMAKPK